MAKTIRVSQQSTTQGVSVNQESPAQNMAFSNGTKFMRGEPGATFTPHVDAEGNLSWKNDNGLENPETVNVKGPQGKPGVPGADGHTPVKGTDYFTEADIRKCAEAAASLVEVPKNVSAFENDANYLTDFTEDDPTVPAWAKAAAKPSYTAEEVGADSKGAADAALASAKAYADQQIAAIPAPDVSGQIAAHNVATDAHNDIRLLIGGLTSRLNALADSDDTTLDQLSEVVAYIKANRELIDSVTTAKVNVSDIVDNLTTNVADRPLSAAQGVVLKALIDAITVPTKVSDLENDAGYLGEADKEALIAEITDNVLYTDLSYIQTDAKAYILTDFIPTSKTRVRMRGFFPLGSSTKSMFGAMTSTSSNRFDLGSNSSSKYLIGWNKTTAASSLAELEEPFEVDMNRNTLYINGEEAATIAEAEWEGAYPLAIFARNVKGTVGSIINSGSQVEWMEIYEDDVLVRDFVPRKHLTEGCGLFDRLSGKFWGNAYTSGAFTGE